MSVRLNEKYLRRHARFSEDLRIAYLVSTGDLGTSHLGEQRMRRLACAYAHSRQSIRYYHKQSMDVDEGSDQILDLSSR